MQRDDPVERWSESSKIPVDLLQTPSSSTPLKLVLDFVGSLQDTFALMLPRGCPSVDESAGLANTSPRTLQRRLCDAGLSFSQIVDRARFRIAYEHTRARHDEVTKFM